MALKLKTPRSSPPTPMNLNPSSADTNVKKSDERIPQPSFQPHPIDYEALANLATTESPPQTSWVVVADVRGSTEAIKKGKYRDVNLVGAACIAAIRNQFPLGQIPYVFGGDGATFLVPNSQVDQCIQILNKVKIMADKNFGLTLGIGAVPVGSLMTSGAEIRIGHLKWGEVETMSYFRGKGLALAEKQIKSAQNLQQNKTVEDKKINFDSETPPPIEGLSCRLLPFKALRGRILSLVIEPRVPWTEEDAIYQKIFAVFKSKHSSLEAISPLSEHNLRRPWLGGGLLNEVKIYRKNSSLVKTFQQITLSFITRLITKMIFYFKLNTKILGDVNQYESIMLRQSDWIKMDGSLRMVIDVTDEEESLLRLLLDQLESEGALLYGCFASQSALMTCHFKSIEGHQHTHFIDGSDGGLTLAALELKTKKKAMKGI